MVWVRGKRCSNTQKYYSIIGKLTREEKINDPFLISMGRLTIEEIIAIKLELTSKSCGGTMYCLPIWHSIGQIVKDACLKFALSATKTKLEAANFLGLTFWDYEVYLAKFKPVSYFRDENKKQVEGIKRY